MATVVRSEGGQQWGSCRVSWSWEEAEGAMTDDRQQKNKREIKFYRYHVRANNCGVLQLFYISHHCAIHIQSEGTFVCNDPPTKQEQQVNRRYRRIQ